MSDIYVIAERLFAEVTECGCSVDCIREQWICICDVYDPRMEEFCKAYLAKYGSGLISALKMECYDGLIDHFINEYTCWCFESFTI